MFTNATTVPGLEQLITRAVRTQLQRDGRVRLGTDASSAAQLRGEVTHYGLSLLATDPNDFALEYRIEVGVHVMVEELLDHKLAVTIDYVVSSQVVPNEIARERAMLAAAREAGDRVVSFLLDRF